MIYTVTLNPSLDYVVSVEEFEAGKINRTISESVYAGGKGINVSTVLKEFEIDSVALGFISGFTGQELQRLLQEQGICTEFINSQNGLTRINMKLRSDILIEPESDGVLHQETEINGQGPIVSKQELLELMQKIEQLSEEDILVLSGSACRGVTQSIYADIVKICNKRNVRVVVDASNELLWNTLEHNPFLIKPNNHELGEIFKCKITSKEEMVFYARKMQKCGARNVLVSAGKSGAILLTEDGNVYEMDAPIGVVINSVGAGDSMVAGFLAGYLIRNNYEEALKFAVCAGSATAFSEGLAKKCEIMTLMR